MSTTWLIDKNLAQGTLASGYTAGSTTITLASGQGALFDSPTGSQAIMLAVNGPKPDFFLVCTGRSSDTLTVASTGAEGTTAVSESTGCQITQVITAGVLTALLAAAGSVVYGPIASLPGTPPSAGLYYCSDSPYIFVSDASAWHPYAFGFPCVRPPATASWTQRNFGTSSLSTNGGYPTLVIQNNSGDVFRGYTVTKPGTSYTVIAGMKEFNKGGAGIGLYDSSSGKSLAFMWGTDYYLHIFLFSSGWGSISSVFTSSSSWSAATPEITWLKIVEDLTHRTYYLGLDPFNWVQVYQEAAATNFTPTDVGFGTDSNGASPSGIALFSFSTTSP